MFEFLLTSFAMFIRLLRQKRHQCRKPWHVAIRIGHGATVLQTAFLLNLFDKIF